MIEVKEVPITIRYFSSCCRCGKCFDTLTEQKPDYFQMCSYKCRFNWTYDRLRHLPPNKVLSFAKMLLTKQKSHLYSKNLIFILTKEFNYRNLYINLLAHELAHGSVDELAHRLSSFISLGNDELSHEPSHYKPIKANFKGQEVLF